MGNPFDEDDLDNDVDSLEEVTEEKDDGPKVTPTKESMGKQEPEEDDNEEVSSEEKPKKKRKKRTTIQMTKEMKEYVIKNYNRMSIDEIKDQLVESFGQTVNRQQVDNAWRQAKKKMEEHAQKAEEEGDTQLAEKYRAKIEKLFPPKEDNRGAKRGRTSDYEDIISDLLNED